MPNCSLLSKSLLLATETDFWQPNGPHCYAPTLRKGYQHDFQLLYLFEIWAAPRPPADSIVLAAFSRMEDRWSQALGGDHYQTALTHWPETCLYSGDKMATRRPAQWLGRKTELGENVRGICVPGNAHPPTTQPSTPSILQVANVFLSPKLIANKKFECKAINIFSLNTITLTKPALHVFKRLLCMRPFKIEFCNICTVCLIECFFINCLTMQLRAVYNKIELHWFKVVFPFEVGFDHFGITFQCPSSLLGEYLVLMTSKIWLPSLYLYWPAERTRTSCCLPVPSEFVLLQLGLRPPRPSIIQGQEKELKTSFQNQLLPLSIMCAFPLSFYLKISMSYWLDQVNSAW